MARKRTTFLPLMMFELAMASAETIAHRTVLMATGRCTPMEYARMMAEKLRAVQQTTRIALSPGANGTTLLAPWHSAAKRNSKRLRRK
jgi:hypothetical protein